MDCPEIRNCPDVCRRIDLTDNRLVTPNRKCSVPVYRNRVDWNRHRNVKCFDAVRGNDVFSK